MSTTYPTHAATRPAHLLDRLPATRRLLRTRWPYLLGLIPVMAQVAVFVVAPRPHGHWSDHLGGVAIDWSGAPVLVIGAWLARRRLGWTVVIVPVIVVGLLVAGTGDRRVANSIWEVPGYETQSFQADDPADYDSGHELDEQGGRLMLIAGLLFVLAVGVTGRVSRRAAVVATLFAIIPPWIAGGFGAWWITARVTSEELRRPETGGASSRREASPP